VKAPRRPEARPTPRLGALGARITLPFVAAAALLAASLAFPYWELRLNAPQYPRGLYMTVYIDHIRGDIREIDGLNHYIGMAPLGEAAKVERSLAMAAMVGLIGALAAAAVVRARWGALLALPAVLLPPVFLADLYYWLRRFGRNLDPNAALADAIPPFTPRILGHGAIAQFSTDAMVQAGFWLALAAAALAAFGFWTRWVRRAVPGAVPVAVPDRGRGLDRDPAGEAA